MTNAFRFPVLCILVLAGICNSQAQTDTTAQLESGPEKLLVEVEPFDDSYDRAAESAAGVVDREALIGPVARHRVVELDRDVIERLFRVAQESPEAFGRAFDLTVYAGRPCIVESAYAYYPAERYDREIIKSRCSNAGGRWHTAGIWRDGSSFGYIIEMGSLSRFVVEAVNDGKYAVALEIDYSIVSDARRTDCARRGGTISSGGIAGLPLCFVPFSDGGRECSDSSQCEGMCMIDVDRDATPRAACQTQSPHFGCFVELKDGARSPPICSD